MKTVKIARMASIAAFAAILTGCADTKELDARFHEADDFGHAVREDLAAQIVDPDVAYSQAPPASSGSRAALAQARYAADNVRQPVSGPTTAGVTGGGNSGGGGSGGGQ